MEPSAQQSNRLGRYRLLSTLGQGGMGTIWLAVARGLGEFRKLLVIKELRWDLTRNERFVEMFFDEAKLAARLNHPNVVQTLEAGEEDNRYFLSMEFLDGQPLSAVMKRAAQDSTLSLAVRLRILCGALAGLHYAHELRDYDGTDLQIVHRDVSPQNVFITYDGQVKVVDFGIAKVADAGTLTQPGIFKGKFAYASPEQIKGHPVDRRADVFSMGVLLWEVVTLRRFAKGKPTQLSIEARLTGLEPRLAEVERDVEPLLSEICDRAMQIEPSKRFATAEDFRLALEQYLVVTGEVVETTAIAAFMRQAFAAERATMHRMIDGHLKDADLSESLVRRLRPTPREITDQDPTTVADLSELIQSSRSQLPDASANEGGESSTVNGWHGPLRSGRGRKAWIAGVVLGIAALTVYMLREQLPAMNALRRPEAMPLEAPAPAPPQPSEPAPPPAQLLAAPPVVAMPPAPAQADKQQEVAPIEEPERKARRQAQRASDGDDDEGGPVPGMLFGSFEDDPENVPFQGPRMEEWEGEREQAASKSAPAVGEDLRELRKDKRRKLDLEDPFQ